MAEPPKAYFTNEKWDQALDLMLRRTVYGTLAGGVAALVLLSESTACGWAGTLAGGVRCFSTVAPTEHC